MAKRSQRRIVRYEKDQAGCMWGLISIFDFRYGRSSRKLLSDRRRGNRHAVVSKGAGYNGSKLKMLTNSGEQCRSIEDGDGDDVAAADVIKASVKELMEEEMLTEQGPKKHTNTAIVELEQFDSVHGVPLRKNHNRRKKTSTDSCDIHMSGYDNATNMGPEVSCHQIPGDKRQFQPKSLTNEIQVRYEEQKRLQQIQEISQPDYQFAFSFRDEEVLFDVARLMLTFADNNNSADFAKVVPFIKEFVPLFFGIDTAKFEQRVQTSGRDTPNDSGEDTPSPDDDLSQRSQKGKKGDLRRTILDPNNKPRKDKEDSVASASRDSTPDTSGMDDEAAGDSSNSNPRADQPKREWIEYVTTPTAFGDKEFEHEEPYQRVEFNMYSNASIYCFFRMFVMLYERLLKLKESEEEVRKVINRAKEPKAAQKLKMLDKQPEDFFKDTSSSANYYQQLLDMFTEQISGEVDMNFIEETLRRYYLQIGWQLYSFDRLLSSLVRFALAVVSHDNKDKSLDIYNLFRKDRVNDTTTHKNEISYRKAVEKFAKDADTYRITYNPTKMEAHVRLFKKDDPTFEFNTLDRVKRWRAYVASYMAVEPTEEVDLSRVHYPYLKKRLARTEDLSEEERFDHVKHSDKITVSISPSAYIMTFINSEPFGTGGVQYFVQPDAVRAGLSEAVPKPTEEYKKLNDERRERVQEILVRNNSWMKDLSRDDVDAKKAAFKKDLEEPRKVADNEDVDMDGADGFD